MRLAACKSEQARFDVHHALLERMKLGAGKCLREILAGSAFIFRENFAVEAVLSGANKEKREE